MKNKITLKNPYIGNELIMINKHCGNKYRIKIVGVNPDYLLGTLFKIMFIKHVDEKKCKKSKKEGNCAEIKKRGICLVKSKRTTGAYSNFYQRDINAQLYCVLSKREILIEKINTNINENK